MVFIFFLNKMKKKTLMYKLTKTFNPLLEAKMPAYDK